MLLAVYLQLLTNGQKQDEGTFVVMFAKNGKLDVGVLCSRERECSMQSKPEANRMDIVAQMNENEMGRPCEKEIERAKEKEDMHR